MTGAVSVVDTRRAGPDAGDCPLCQQPLERGRRIAYIRRPAGHDWTHLRCALTEGNRATAIVTEPDGPP